MPNASVVARFRLVHFANPLVLDVSRPAMFRIPGLPSSQLKAVYDHWVVRGSTLDLEDFAGDHASEFGIDPNAEEIAFLKETVDLTPKCSSASDGCFLNLNADGLSSLEGDYDFVISIRGAGGGGLNSKERGLGTKILWIDDKYEKGMGCYGILNDADMPINEESCYGRSLMDVVLELEQLAKFLGVKATAKVREEQQAMCAAAADFVEHSKGLHEKGIYAAAISMRPFNGITLNWFSPIHFPWLRTLEELGFPLLHPPNITKATDYYSTRLRDWFVRCEEYPACRGEGAIGRAPIDLWLMDSRTYATVDATYDDSLAEFPDPAFAKRQYTYWQFNDGAISYTNIVRYLKDVMAATSEVQRVHQETVACADGLDVTSRDFLNKGTGGVMSVVPGSGTYACRGNLQSLYTECPAMVEPTEPVEPSQPSQGEDDPSAESLSLSSGILRIDCRVAEAMAIGLAVAINWM